MYAPYFGLQKAPFSIAPDPHFLFMSEMHREALAHLLYGLSGGGGFVLLTGEIGAGKTTVCRAFLEQMPAHCAVAYVFNPRLSAIELLQTVCEEFHIEVQPRTPGAPATVKDHVDALNRFLLQAHAEGRQGVLIIDEAQALDAPVLEQLRLLTNLETHERKLLQIVLIGQPELRDMLARPELEQLAQRVIARCHLPALSAEETAQYVRHRLAVAGPAAPMPFDAGALATIHQRTGGVPRRINLLCDRALLGAYAHGRNNVDRAGVLRAAQEVFGDNAGPARGQRSRRLWAVGAGAAAGLVALAVALGLWRWVAPPQAPAVLAGAAQDATPGGTPTSPGSVNTALADAPPPGTSDNGTPADSDNPAPPRVAELATVLAAAHRSEAAAWRELATRWSLVLVDGDPCTSAPAAGVACFRATGGLPVLRPLDRPGLLRLEGGGGPAWVLLTGLGPDSATVQAAGQRWTVPLEQLARAWRGDFATLWRTPPGWGAGLAAPEVQGWVAGQLATHRPAGTAAGLSLRDQVRAFQLVQGLPADGIAGPVTLMRLSQVVGVAEPRLGTS
jgi:general secretion pathway protein A